MTYEQNHRPKGVWLLFIILSSMAALQLLTLSFLLLVEPSSAAARDAIASLSAVDLIGLYGLSAILLTAVVYLFRMRRRAIPWFAVYIGLGSWVALGYSLAPQSPPHFDELVSLGGLLVALAIFGYMLRLRRQDKLA